MSDNLFSFPGESTGQDAGDFFGGAGGVAFTDLGSADEVEKQDRGFIHACEWEELTIPLSELDCDPPRDMKKAKRYQQLLLRVCWVPLSADKPLRQGGRLPLGHRGYL